MSLDLGYPTDFVFRNLQGRPVIFHPLLAESEIPEINEDSEEIDLILARLQQMQTALPFACAENNAAEESSLKAKKVTFAPKCKVKIYDPNEYESRPEQFTLDTVFETRYCKDPIGYCCRNPIGPSLRTQLKECHADLNGDTSGRSLNTWAYEKMIQLRQFILQEVEETVTEEMCFKNEVERCKLIERMIKEIKFGETITIFHGIFLQIANDMESGKFLPCQEVGEELVRRFQALNTKLIFELADENSISVKALDQAGIISSSNMDFYLSLLKSISFDPV